MALFAVLCFVLYMYVCRCVGVFASSFFGPVCVCETFLVFFFFLFSFVVEETLGSLLRCTSLCSYALVDMRQAKKEARWLVVTYEKERCCLFLCATLFKVLCYTQGERERAAQRQKASSRVDA